MRFSQYYFKNTVSISFTLLLICVISIARAQVFWDYGVANNVQTCLQPENADVKFTLLAAQAANSTLRIAAPSGTSIYSVFSVTKNNVAVANTVVFSQANRVATITFTGTIALSDEIRVQFRHFASCAAGISSYTIRDSFLYNSTSISSSFLGNLFNGSSPALSITNITNTPGTANVGLAVVRKYKITNGGNGASSHFFVSDNFGSGNLAVNLSSFRINPSGVNYTIPGAKITLVADSVRISFDPSQIQQVGDGDTLFEFGENFELQYEVTPLNCGIGNVILSKYRTSWLCPSNSRCNYYSVSDGLSISIPGAPNIVYFQTALRKNDCWNNSLWIDTGSIKNIGTGPAKDIIINVGVNGYPTIFRGDMAGYFDTTNFFVKKGKNGSWQKVSYSVITVASNYFGGIGCNLAGKPISVQFTWPLLNANDTLYFTSPIVYCNWSYGCEASQNYLHQIGIPGSLLQIDGYKNGCGNISLTGFKAAFLGYGYPALQAQSVSPQAVNKNTRANFAQILQNIPYNFNFNSKAVTDVKINLPSVLQYDTAFGPLVYIVSGTTTIYPTSHPSANVWRFKNAVLPSSGVLNIQLKGYCDPSVCSGIVNWGYEWSTNPDTTFCSNFNRWACLSFPISWTSDCKLCCDSGLVNLEYTTNRVNFGLPDNNNDLLPDGSGSIDLTKVRTNNFLYNDTVEYYQKSYVLQGVTPWSSLVGEFDVPNSTSWWDLISNEVKIIRAAGGTSTASATANWSGNSLRLNYSSLAPFYNNDTVYFKVRLRLKANTETGFVTQNAAYVSHVNNVNQSGATRFSCGPIIDNLVLWPQGQFLDRVQDLSANGCNQIVEGNYFYTYEGSYGYGGINRFPFEYRGNAYPTKVKHKYPSGWQVDSVALVFYSGSNFPGAYANLNVPFTFVNDTLKYDLASYFTPNGGLLVPSDEGGTLGVYHYLKPSCKAIKNTSFVVPAQNDWNSLIIKSNSYPYNSGSYNTQTSIRNIQPQFLVNSATPVSTAFTKNVSWPLTYSNVTAINSVNNWIYLNNVSGTVTIDSVKEGGTIIPKDVNGFYRLGAINASTTRSLRIYATSNACNLDSVRLDWGYGCNGYPTSLAAQTCNYPPLTLFVQPAPAAIQTTITALANTPINPSNPGGGNYGQNTIYMCSSFPMEFHIVSTEPGTIYSVKEKVYLPISGLNVGLDYISDSGYIEFPVGTPPRKFSIAANTALLSQVSSGVLTFDLAQIDPTNFNPTNGLFGTGTAPTNDYRKAILRFKFKSNCNLISGAQWQAVQEAISPCGNPAGGNLSVTSGFPLNIFGVTPVPYVATVAVVPSLKGCDGDTATFKVIKIGNSAVGVGDSIRIFIPQELAASAFKCNGSVCPSPNPVFKVNPALGGTEYAIRIPVAMANLDSLIFKTKINTPQPFGCANSVRLGADITRQLTIYCPTILANCPNAKQSLGSSTSFISVKKPNLTMTSFSGSHLINTKYIFSGTVANAATAENVSPGTTTRIMYFWDVNNNSTFEFGTDKVVGYTNRTNAIPAGGSLSWTDTITDASGVWPPNPALRLVAVIDATGIVNCNCAAMAYTPFLINLSAANKYYSMFAKACYSKLIRKADGLENINNIAIEINVNGNWVLQKTLTPVNGSGISQMVKANSGSNLYRISETDKLGKKIYVATFVTQNDCNDSELKIIPNPSNGLVEIQFNQNTESKLRIYNAAGKVITTQLMHSSKQLDLSAFATGVYIVELTNENIVYTAKLMIVK